MPDSQVEHFLYHEARLMDESRYEEWLDLWSEDALYWVPCNDDDIDPARHVSIIYDDRERLVQRVDRLKSGSVLAQQPKPRMRRLISNIEIVERGSAQLTVHSNFILGVARGGTQQIWAGRSIHELRSQGDSFKIARKTVLLIENDQEIPLLQFLI
ncbi:MAG TPA: aromatic-ring-hydroxylating dioxygenase subunit beta [Candidatus Binatia bacterium]|nr:aromatic-ring-hydroxylating dioxygenase subunit beta [Candidatus Binatia bacterium]